LETGLTQPSQAVRVRFADLLANQARLSCFSGPCAVTLSLSKRDHAGRWPVRRHAELVEARPRRPLACAPSRWACRSATAPDAGLCAVRLSLSKRDHAGRWPVRRHAELVEARPPRTPGYPVHAKAWPGAPSARPGFQMSSV